MTKTRIDDKSVFASTSLRIVRGSIFEHHKEVGLHSILYDKDAFGALPPDMRDIYMEEIMRYLRDGCVVLLSGMRLSVSVLWNCLLC